jgi:inner membrane protein
MEPRGKFARGARRHAVIIRIIVIGIMVLALLVPLFMIKAINGERQARRDAAQAEIINSWGGQQTLAGPILTVPFVTRAPDANGKLVASVSYAHFLPDALRIEGDVSPETRHRGIYDATLYTAALRVSGVFSRPDFSGWGISAKDILWDNAVVSVELPDMRALLDRITLRWGASEESFRPGKATAGLFGGGIEAPVAVTRMAQTVPFSFPLRLHGGGSLSFLPLGDETAVALRSPWPSPSFNGSYLPASRTVDATGFQAEWKVISMARPYPQRWRQGDLEPGTVDASGFGVDFMRPVDTYLKVERALKYGVLFLVLPFGTLFLLEVFSGRRLHPLHYLLVGLANCVFYLLLLSLSEHIPFDAAYAAASAASAGLVTVYVVSIMKSVRGGIAILPVLAAGYGFLALVLRSEDFALLVGALGLFLVLGAVMMLTRKVDWYGMGFHRAKSAPSAPESPAGE